MNGAKYIIDSDHGVVRVDRLIDVADWILTHCPERVAVEGRTVEWGRFAEARPRKKETVAEEYDRRLAEFARSMAETVASSHRPSIATGTRVRSVKDGDGGAVIDATTDAVLALFGPPTTADVYVRWDVGVSTWVEADTLAEERT